MITTAPNERRGGLNDPWRAAVGRRQLEDERPFRILGRDRRHAAGRGRRRIRPRRAADLPTGDAARAGRLEDQGRRAQSRRPGLPPEASGAFTGDISAPMLKDAGATYVIVGHSERRTLHHETDALVRAKAKRRLGAGLIPIVCVGETKPERQSGDAMRGRPAATSGLAAAGRRAGDFRRRLRADLGDRNRTHPDACGRRGDAPGDPDAAGRHVWRRKDCGCAFSTGARSNRAIAASF